MRLLNSIMTGASLGALVLAISPSAVLAQTTAEAPGDSSTISTIVVTARKSQERLQDVPLAISAVTARELQSSHNVGLTDIAKLTPGLKFTAYLDNFNGNVTIRGLQQENVQNAVGNVGTFLDGIYLQRGYLVDSTLGDYERVEVVKGPQSALYGQNTFAGAVNFVVRQPTDAVHVNGEVTVGNGDLIEERLGVGGPLIKGILDGRIYAADSDFSGLLKNTWPGPTTNGSQYFGGHRYSNYSFGLKFTPTDKLTINGFYNYVVRWQQINPFYTIDGDSTQDQLNCGAPTSTGTKSLWCGALPNNTAAFRTGVGNPPPGFSFQPQPGTTTIDDIWKMSASYRMTDSLTLSYTFGDVRGSSLEQANFSTNAYNPPLSPFFPFIAAQREGGLLQYASHELRLVYNGSSPFKAELGYFHSDSDDHLIFGLLFVSPGVPYKSLTTSATDLSNVTVPFTNQDSTYKVDSPFARLTYDFLENRAQLSAELRYTTTRLTDNDLLARAATPGLPLLTASYGDFTPRFTAQYKIAPDDMIYVSAARGAKAGGFNGYVAGSVQLLASQQAFGEETNWTYELGWKATVLDHTLTFNADVFYVDWNNKQEAVEPSNYVPVNSQSGGVSPQIYENVGNATSYGLELTSQWRPTGHLLFNGSLSLQNPTYAKGAQALPFTAVCDNIVCKASGDISGNEIAQVSRVSADFGGEYHGELSNNIKYALGLDEGYRGGQFADDVNVAKINPYWLTDMHLSISRDIWSLSLWGKNMFDARYVDAAFVIPSIYQYNVNIGQPRSFGVTVAVNY